MSKHTIKNDKNIKILGITFDSKCSWTPHILQLKQACANRLNTVRLPLTVTSIGRSPLYNGKFVWSRRVLWEKYINTSK